MQSDDRLDRAKQFMPFDALKGFKEALRAKEISVEEHKDLSIEKSTDINNILSKLKVGDLINITYYENYKYVSKKINIKKISFQSGKIIINNNIIYFDDLYDIKIIY